MNIQLLPRRGQLTDSIQRITALIATATKFLERRAQFEARLNAQLASADFDVTDATIADHSATASAVTIATALEPRLIAALRECADRGANVIAQAATDVSGLQSQIDQLIREIVASQIPATVGRVTVDHKTSTLYQQEIAARFVWNGFGGYVPGSSIEQLLATLKERQAQMQKLIAEQDRCAAVLAQLSKQAA